MDETIFNQTVFSHASEKMISELTELLSDYAEDFFFSPVENFMNELCEKQRQEKLEPISCISLSMLRTALANEECGYRIDAYGEDWLLYERPLSTVFIACDWFLPVWKALLNYFEGILKNQEIQKNCFPLQAEQAAWKCIGPAWSFMGSLLKYSLETINKTESYKKLIKGNEFHIEFGEFLDWKVFLSAEYPEIDIFNSRGRQFAHHRFTQKLFQKKRFFRLNLKGCVFCDCEFKNCSIEQSVMNDCVFKRCKFTDVTFQDSFLAGARFEECTLENSSFQKVIACFEGLPPEKADDWYCSLLLFHTSINHVAFCECDLRGALMEQCTTTFTTLENTLTDLSDFSVLIPETRE